MKNFPKNNIRYSLLEHLLCVVVVSCLLFAADNTSASQVTAMYKQSTGKAVTVLINVGAPAPSSLILIQKFPQGAKIIHSDPSPQKNNSQKGQAKWLFRNPGEGHITVTFSFDRQVKAGEISGQIRFKNTGNRMESFPVEKL